MEHDVPAVNIQQAEESGDGDKPSPDHAYDLLKTIADVNLEKDYAWMQQHRCTEIFERLLACLREVGKRLHLGNKMDPRLLLPITQPKTEQLQLLSRAGGDVKAAVSLLGDNVIHCEIALRHSKSPGGFYRGVVQSEVQWKLQQLQDLSNLVVRGAFQVLEAKLRLKALIDAKAWDKQAGAVLHTALRDIRNTLCAAKNTLIVPRKKSPTELFRFPPTKKLSPPLPANHCLSVMVNGTRLVCTVYQIRFSEKDPEPKVLGTSAECAIPGLSQILLLINSCQQYTQNFLNTLDQLQAAAV